MRLAVFKPLLFGAAALIFMGAFAGCENPFDPLDKSDKIEGLTYVDFSATWERWDSDPEYDGITVTPEYYNEFSETLSFHDKPHSVVIEMWSQRDSGKPNAEGEIEVHHWQQDELLFSTSVEFSDSDDTIRIPIESYSLAVKSVVDEGSGEATGFLVVRIYPPQEYPRQELQVAYPDTIFFKPEVAETTPNP